MEVVNLCVVIIPIMYIDILMSDTGCTVGRQ